MLSLQEASADSKKYGSIKKQNWCPVCQCIVQCALWIVNGARSKISVGWAFSSEQNDDYAFEYSFPLEFPRNCSLQWHSFFVCSVSFMQMHKHSMSFMQNSCIQLNWKIQMLSSVYGKLFTTALGKSLHVYRIACIAPNPNCSAMNQVSQTPEIQNIYLNFRFAVFSVCAVHCVHDARCKNTCMLYFKNLYSVEVLLP